MGTGTTTIRRRITRRATAGLGALAFALAGCESKSFLNPGEVGRYEKTPLVVPILDDLGIGLQGEAAEFATAREVRASDLVPGTADYRIGPNDQVQVTVLDLQERGTSSFEVKRVSEGGKISLQFVGPIQVAGLTETEAEQTVKNAYVDAGILRDTQVSVFVTDQQNRLFSIYGSIGRPGLALIQKNDFRLLDAIIAAGGVTSDVGIDDIFIIRKVKPEDQVAPTGTNVNAPSGTQPAPTGFDPLLPGTALPKRNPPLAAFAQPAEEPVIVDPMTPATEPALVAPEDEGTVQIADAPPTPPAANEPATVTGIEVPPEPIDLDAPASVAATQAFEFDAPQEPTDREVIRVPYDELKRGVLKYNVVIQPDDLVYVTTPPIGEYYMGGHVLRTGVYSLTARNITLKQAVISAGMFDEVAIPARTDLIRRVGGKGHEVYVRVNLDKIFAGLEPDIYLKPDDSVMVGTNAGAPFLAAFRNAFRITYGFGFLYDRNYAAENQFQ